MFCMLRLNFRDKQQQQQQPPIMEKDKKGPDAPFIRAQSFIGINTYASLCRAVCKYIP